MSCRVAAVIGCSLSSWKSLAPDANRLLNGKRYRC